MSDIPAFPEPGLSGLPNGEFIHSRAGMTLRDYFAAAALPGMLYMVAHGMHDAAKSHDGAAKQAYELADAMLKAREPQP